MREFRITVARFEPDNKAKTDGANAHLAMALTMQCGGLTRIEATGWWMPGGEGFEVVCEPVYVYEVAGDLTDADVRKIVLGAFKHSKQEAIYVRYPDGSVENVRRPQ